MHKSIRFQAGEIELILSILTIAWYMAKTENFFLYFRPRKIFRMLEFIPI